MVAPPLPITSLILLGSILKVIIRGAKSDIVSLVAGSALFISSRMCKRPCLACSSAACIISAVIPSILISICNAVIPSPVPATLKSISPRWSSSPMISESTAYSSPSLIKPIAIPATAALVGTPASINARLVPHTEAIELEPLDSVTSETTRITYGNSSMFGMMASTPRFARRP